MSASCTALEGKSFDHPEQTLTDDTGKVDVVTRRRRRGRQGRVRTRMALVGPRQANRLDRLLPGAPYRVHPQRCMVVRMDDGDEHEFGPGDAFLMPPGHDAWIVGDEPCELIDFTGMRNYAAARDEPL